MVRGRPQLLPRPARTEDDPVLSNNTCLHSEGWAEGIRFFDTTASDVVLTSAIQAFLDEAWTTGSRPQLRTNHDAHLSWFVADELRRLGGQWIVFGPDGVDHDAHTGLPTEAPPGSRAAHLPIDTTQPPACLALTFDVQSREAATWTTACGRVAELMVRALGGGALTMVDTTEPLGHVWSTSELTTRLRGEMPLTRRHLARSTHHAIATVQVRRTEEGLAEHSRGIVPVPQWRLVTPEMIRLVSDALTELASRFRLTVATVKLTMVDVRHGRLGHLARPRPTDLPVALLLGPTLVRGLGMDLDTARERFHATTVGLTKAPALLVPLSDDPQRHHQFLTHIDSDLSQSLLGEALAWDAPTRKV